MDDLFKGYKGETLKLLKKFNVRVWSEVDIKSSRGEFSGIILPRSENDDETHLVIKLITGYNIGLETGTIKSIIEKGFKEANYKIPEKEFPYSEGKPNLKLFGTGGTIASRLDYRTGAVIPAFSPGELYGAVPELADICNLSTEKLAIGFQNDIIKFNSGNWRIFRGKVVEHSGRQSLTGSAILKDVEFVSRIDKVIADFFHK